MRRSEWRKATTRGVYVGETIGLGEAKCRRPNNGQAASTDLPAPLPPSSSLPHPYIPSLLHPSVRFHNLSFFLLWPVYEASTCFIPAIPRILSSICLLLVRPMLLLSNAILLASFEYVYLYRYVYTHFFFLTIPRTSSLFFAKCLCDLISKV